MQTISQLFPVLGEPLAVELANTRPMREGARQDLLVTDADAVAWLRLHSGALPARADQAPPTAARLRELRGSVDSLFEALLAGRAPAAEAIRHVNETCAAAPQWLTLEWRRGGAPTAVASADRPPRPAVPLGAIARSAIELLGDPRGPRLRRCEAPGCVLLFVATNPRRRWCSAATCGNRVRVARHYERLRRDAPP